MHAFQIIAAIAVLATPFASALPTFGFGAGNGCLTKHSAYQLVQNFISVTNGDAFDENLANALIAENVVDTSGSVASIINAGNVGPVPLLGPTLVNRTAFIAANSAQASTPYEPLNVYWTCDVVTFRFQIPFEPQPVLGITILETQPAPAGSQFPFQIKQVFGELNSFAFLVDLGLYEPIPAPPPPSRARFRLR